MAAKDFSQVPGDVYQLPTDSQNSDASPNPPVPPSPAQGLLGSHALYSAAPLNSSSSMTFWPVIFGSDLVSLFPVSGS